MTEVIYFRHNKKAPPRLIEQQRFPIFELTLVEAGELCYYIDGREVRAGAGDGVFVPAGAMRARRRRQEPADYVSFNFTASPAPELPCALPAVLGAAERALIAAADEIDRRRGGEAQMAHLVNCLLCGIEARFLREREHPLVRRIKQYIETHLQEPITLADIGEAAYFSPIYCETVFKKETGSPIGRYIARRRVNEAERLLLEGTLSLREVAAAVGFADYNYFARTFKKVTGRTPRAAKAPLTGV